MKLTKNMRTVICIVLFAVCIYNLIFNVAWNRTKDECFVNFAREGFVITEFKSTGPFGRTVHIKADIVSDDEYFENGWAKTVEYDMVNIVGLKYDDICDDNVIMFKVYDDDGRMTAKYDEDEDEIVATGYGMYYYDLDYLV